MSTELHLAARSGDTAHVELLVLSRADVNARDIDRSCTPLHEAAWYGHTAAVEALLAGGAVINARDRSGCTPLHEAACQGQLEVAQTLLLCSADVTAVANEMSLPISFAERKGHRDVAALLHNASQNASGECDLVVTLRKSSKDVQGCLLTVNCTSLAGSKLACWWIIYAVSLLP
eukprot:gnl/TRDRNA2_/TRDRNA2_92184_c0_seq2.p1 gnl/TRDRNA2_/TRDRNA2_92184_c0~~gnl/TRDRNA2_/TRDRNA2_92184_c0_seq2.p1  ORF type:complete len:175 (-),score=28.06 gnl/TRDRNA2_/TRDRNA2_92184_c0_seq2:204-728(-)